MLLRRTLTGLFAIGLLSASEAPGGASESSPWRELAPMPTARTLHSVSVVDGRIYALAGSTTVSLSTGVLEVYDPATDAWSRRADLPVPTCGPAAAVVNGRIYLFGGLRSVYGMVTSATWEYDPAEDRWTAKAPMPTPRGFLSAEVVEGKVYLIGGGTAHGIVAYRVVELYDPATDSWQARAEMPSARFAHATAAVNGRIYAFGGAVDGNLVGLTTVEVYDLAADRWTTLPAMPIGRCLHSAAVVAGRVYLIGGSSGSALVASVEEYDPAANLWRERSPIPSPRWGLATGIVGGHAYALGGADLDNARVAYTDEYSPEAEPPPPSREDLRSLPPPIREARGPGATGLSPIAAREGRLRRVELDGFSGSLARTIPRSTRAPDFASRSFRRSTRLLRKVPNERARRRMARTRIDPMLLASLLLAALARPLPARAPLWIGFVGGNSRLSPVGRFDGDRWTNPWPVGEDPTGPQPPPLPEAKPEWWGPAPAPKGWFLGADDAAPRAIRLGRAVREDEGLEATWMVETDAPAQGAPDDPSTWGTRLATSRPVPFSWSIEVPIGSPERDRIRDGSGRLSGSSSGTFFPSCRRSPRTRTAGSGSRASAGSPSPTTGRTTCSSSGTGSPSKGASSTTSRHAASRRASSSTPRTPPAPGAGARRGRR